MGGMKDTLGDEPYLPLVSPHQLARTTDPGTSHQAAAKVIDKLRPIQKRVLAELKTAGRSGLTDLELEEICGSHGSTFRTRRSELVDAGLVVDSGKKKNQKGRNRIVWVAAEFQ